MKKAPIPPPTTARNMEPTTAPTFKLMSRAIKAVTNSPPEPSQNWMGVKPPQTLTSSLTSIAIDHPSSIRHVRDTTLARALGPREQGSADGRPRRRCFLLAGEPLVSGERVAVPDTLGGRAGRGTGHGRPGFHHGPCHGADSRDGVQRFARCGRDR